MMRVFIVFMAFILVVGCDKNRRTTKEVDQLISNVEKSAQSAQKKDDSQQKPITQYTYQGATLRDPFETPLATRVTGKKYENTILKTTALDSLKLIGIVLHDNFRLAVFRDNTGQIYEMRVGTRVGIENALLTDIGENEVKFVEEGESTTGQVVSEVVMHLQEPKP